MNAIRVAVLCGAAIGAMACAPHRHPTPPSPEPAVGLDERRLLLTRRQQDSLQVVIASLAVFKAVDPDVRRLAETIVRDHMHTMEDLGSLQHAVHAARDDRRKMAPLVWHFSQMTPGPAFDAAFVDTVLAAHRHDAAERKRLLPRIGDALKSMLESTQPMLELHLRLAEAVKRGIGR